MDWKDLGLRQIANSLVGRRLVLTSRQASPELLTHEPHLLLPGVRMHGVFELISETNAGIVAESRID